MINLLRRNAAFIYFSFLVTGLTTIAPQRLFSAPTAESAQSWVAGTLLIGTVASMAGVGLAGRYGLSGRPALAASVLILGMTVALLSSFAVKTFWIAAALQIVTRFLANYAKQELDHRAVTVAGSGARVANDRVAVIMRFIGMLLGPIWFGAFQLSSVTMLVTVFAMTLISLSSAMDLEPARRPESELSRRPPLTLSERLFIAVGIGIYATYYLLASNIVYVLSQFHESHRASTISGILITVVYGTAMLTSILSLRWKSRHLGLTGMAPAAVLMVVAGLLVISPVASWTVVMGVGAVALGLTFSLYLLAVRNQATMKTRAEDSRWLAFFNNLANTSALLAFSWMAVLVAASRLFHIEYGVILGLGLSGLALASLIGTVVCTRI